MSPHFFQRTRRYKSGGALVPILLIFGALAISAAIFFFFTRKKMEEKAAAEAQMAQVQAQKAAEAAPAPAPPVAEKKPEPAPAPVTPPPAPKPAFGFARPADLGEQLTRSLGMADLAEASKLITAGDPAQQAAALAALEKLKALGYTAAKPDQLQIIGQAGSTLRMAIPLLNKDGSESPHRLLVDVVKDDKMGWKVGGLKFPSELASVLGEMSAPAGRVIAPPPGPPGTGSVPATESKPMSPLLGIADAGDPLTFASDFVRVLLKPDFETAQKFIDEKKVSSVKLAALCIVFEDGAYSLHPSRPLMSTVATEDTNWIIAKVQSTQSNEDTEFGLEMAKADGKWLVTGLNLSRILEDSAKASPEAGVPYTPLVKNPKGGESIALYFEYDSDQLHPRAKRQLDIVAGILKATPESKLKIGGYTDAKGTDDYNLNLSKRRAIAVKKAFIELGVPVSQVDTVGFGAADPLKPNVNPDGTDNPEGRSNNRRAEILLDF